MLRLLTPKTLLLFIPIIGLTGCLEDIVQPNPVAWQGALLPVPGAPTQIAGSVAALSQGSRTQASIRVTGSQPEVVYDWLIRRGTCDAPSTSVIGGRASYPSLSASASGTASADVLLSEAVISGGSFHGALFNAGEPDPIACADLVEI